MTCIELLVSDGVRVLVPLTVVAVEVDQDAVRHLWLLLCRIQNSSFSSCEFDHANVLLLLEGHCGSLLMVSLGCH